MLLNWQEERKPVLGIYYGMQFLSHIDGEIKVNGHVKKIHRFNLQVPSNFP